MTISSERHVVTGAFSYTGGYIARKLLSLGAEVRTLTSHPNPHSPLVDKVQAFPYDFDRPDRLVATLRGATTLYNTYWIRFPHRKVSYQQAIANIETLINAAQLAGVRRIVHLSVANASEDSRLPYFSGKGRVETLIIKSGLSYAILRPTLVFGIEDILINNIAWFLRKFPLFPVAGSGDYPVQPVYVRDIATQAIEVGRQQDNIVADAAGPEIYSYREFVRLIAGAVKSRAKIVGLAPGLALLLSRLTGYLVNDVVLTRHEMEGLMAGLLTSAAPASGKTNFRSWLEENGSHLGQTYTSEMNRHYR